jgi:hypothetical protein
MKTKILVAMLLLAVVGEGVALYLMMHPFHGPMPQGEPTAPPQEEGWVNLLDEAHAGGWKNIGDDRDIFEVKDGMLHIPGTFGKLRYAGYAAESFGDFDLHLEFKVTTRANSGVFLRVPPTESVFRGFEVQVLDDHGRPPTWHTSGAIYDIVTPMLNMSRPTGEWNSYDMSVVGSHVTVRMNGWLVIDTDFSKMTKPLGKFDAPYAEMPKEGLIAFQDHGGEVWYRSVFVKKR